MNWLVAIVLTGCYNSFFMNGKCPQKYATKVFYSEKHALEFKNKLEENSKQTIKTDKLGRFKVRFLIDKTTIKYKQ